MDEGILWAPEVKQLSRTELQTHSEKLLRVNLIAAYLSD